MSKKITGVKLSEPKVWRNTYGDVWETIWAEDDNLYTVSDDTFGIAYEEFPDFSKNPGANFSVNMFCGDSLDNLKGKTINHMLEYGGGCAKVPDGCSDGCCWKAMGITSVDDVLYVSIGRHDYGTKGEDMSLRQTSRNASIIKSTDKGRTWVRSSDDCYKNPMFMGGKFGTPYFIHYGKAGEETVHNSDKYVYAISNNGFWDNGDNMKLGRVLKTKIGNLDAADWEYYKGGNGMEDESWSKYINDAVTDKAGYILDNPGKCSMTGACYIQELEKYIMIQWYYTAGAGSTRNPEKLANLGLTNAGEETVWDFYESDFPWGPWTKFHSHTYKPIGAYNPCIVPKFTSHDGKKIVIFTNGSFHTQDFKGDDMIYRLMTIECELELAVPKPF